MLRMVGTKVQWRVIHRLRMSVTVAILRFTLICLCFE